VQQNPQPGSSNADAGVGLADGTAAGRMRRSSAWLRSFFGAPHQPYYAVCSLAPLVAAKRNRPLLEATPGPSISAPPGRGRFIALRRRPCQGEPHRGIHREPKATRSPLGTSWQMFRRIVG